MFPIATYAKELDKGLCDADCIAVGQWQISVALGIGVRRNPLFDADDTPLLVLPEVSYYGERFFLRNLDMGFTLLETPRHQLNVLMTPSYDQMYFNRWDPLNFIFPSGIASASSASNFAAPPTERNYSNFSIRSNSGSSSAGGGNAGGGNSGSSDPDDISAGVDGSTESPSGPPPENNAGTQYLAISGQVSGATQFIINGVILNGSGSMEGRSGNVIEYSWDEDGDLSLDGFSDSDELLITGGVLEVDMLMGDVKVDQSSLAGAEGVLINTDETNFNVTAAASNAVDGGKNPAPTVSAEADSKVPYDAVKKRRLSGLAGVEYSYSTSWMSAHVQILQEFTNIHHGQEVRGALVFPWYLENQKWAFTVGLNHKSQKVLDYYYGIDESEVANSAWQYQVREGGTETLMRLDWQRPVARHWTLRGTLQYLGLPSEVTRSPLVDQDYVLSVFVGGVYHF